MKRRWLFARDDLRTRVALTEDGALAEYYEELLSGPVRCRSIYAGIVRDVVPAIEAAFVEVGPGEKVFLQLAGSDVLPQVGERVLVQITQVARATKAPQASRELKLAGRFVVLTTGSDHVGIAKRITNAALRDELRAGLQAQLEQLRQEQDDAPDFGVIVRSLAASVDIEVMGAELKALMCCWGQIKERFAHERQAKSAAPALLHEELSLSLRMLRDRVTVLDEVVIDDRRLFDEASSLFASLSEGPDMFEAAQLPRPELFVAQDASLFERESVQDQLLASRARLCLLPSGGSVVIDVGEALCAIDVNSGSSTNAATLEATAFQTNCEAAVEVARQLRLRNIAGIVIVDFIEMRDQSDEKKLMGLFAKELARDHARIRLLPLDEFGLAKLTRKRQ
ncbi:MAG: ribonuclease E/G [Coriobacteriia bacterium]|nr:ribonuclease E/G [Coriobacteriia bacterium]